MVKTALVCDPGGAQDCEGEDSPQQTEDRWADRNKTERKIMIKRARHFPSCWDFNIHAQKRHPSRDWTAEEASRGRSSRVFEQGSIGTRVLASTKCDTQSASCCVAPGAHANMGMKMLSMVPSLAFSFHYGLQKQGVQWAGRHYEKF